MAYKAIVSDWNGTLLRYPTDEPQNRMIAYAALNDIKDDIFSGKIWRVTDVLRLLRTKKQLTERLEEYRQGKRHLFEVYQLFNEGVLRGRSASFVRDVIESYAREAEPDVDSRMVNPIRAAHSNGKLTGILSVSFDYAIETILNQAGAGDVFDVVAANELQTDGNGKVVGLTLDIYGEKPDVLRKEFFEKMGFREKDTLYSGDTEDDEPIADVVDTGNFIVPFFASEEFKQKMASRHRAFVPQDEADLRKYLETK